MARRKRRTYEEAVKASGTEQKEEIVLEWNTAIYARLSVENSNMDDGGESIQRQMEICRNYVEEHPYLHLVGTYVDNGWSGTSTRRPEFQRMLENIHAGKIKAIVVKDFSRFSRDYIEAGNLLENIFPFLKVRFISVVDCYDSFETDGTAQSMLIPLKNLINSYYVKDISEKIKTSLHAKQIAGEYRPGLIPYGYRKSKTNRYKIEPDPETAGIVARLFEMRASGMGCYEIVNTINEEGIPSPGKLRYLRGELKNERFGNCLWSVTGLKKIYDNPMYLGNMEFGRLTYSMYDGKARRQKEPDQSKWRVLKNTHEPLVSQELFDKVAELHRVTKEKWEKGRMEMREQRAANQPLFKDCIFCGDCGYHLTYERYTTLTAITGAYYCSGYTRCTGLHRMPQERLKPIVWNAVQDQISLFADYQKLIRELRADELLTKKQKSLREEKQSTAAKIKMQQHRRERLYEDFADGILSAEEYQLVKKKYEDEYQRLTAQYNELLKQEYQLNRRLSDRNLWILNMQAAAGSDELTREVVEAVIDRILIYQKGKEKRVEVCFKYREDFQVLQAAYNEVFGEQKS